MRVTVVERNAEQRDGCSFGNAGMIVPSHFVPLAAPGMVALGLQVDVESRVAVLHQAARSTRTFVDWALEILARGHRGARAPRARPLLRDLNLASRACFEELADGRTTTSAS